MLTTEEALYLPTHCPRCNSVLEFSETRIDLLCLNQQCSAKVLNKVEHWCRCMGIEEMSVITLEKLEVSSVIMLYELTSDYILGFDGFGERRAQIILEQIDKSLKDVLPAKLIEAFGIQGVGEKNSEAIFKILKGKDSYEKIEHFLNITKEELYFIDGIGQKVAQNIFDMKDECSFIYKHLKDQIKYKENELISEKLLNLKIALTGSCPDGRKRPELEEILKGHGAIPGSVGKTTDILVAEDPNGNSGKLKNARKFGIKIVGYEEFFKDL